MQSSRLIDNLKSAGVPLHSPAVSRENPVFAEHSLLWCFCGSLEQINRAAQDLIGRQWK